MLVTRKITLWPSIGFDMSCSFCCSEATRGSVAFLLTSCLFLLPYLRNQAFCFIILFLPHVLASHAMRAEIRILYAT